MPRRSRGTIALASAPGSVAGLEAKLATRGWKLLRIVTVLYRPRPIEGMRGRIAAFGPFDTIVLTSHESVVSFLGPFGSELRRSGQRPDLWAVGPRTARAARALGLGTVHRAPQEGGHALALALRAGPKRRIVYPRSERAGPELGRQLRGMGHRVLDLVSYRLVPGRRLSRAEQAALRRASALVVTSPSAVSHLRRMVDRATFDALRSSVPVIAVGEQTCRAVRGHGFSGVRRSSNTSAQALTDSLLREFEHGTA